MVITNMPSEIFIDTGETKFYKGNRIRVVTSKGSYIGNIIEISTENMVLHLPLYKGDDTIKVVNFSDIEKMRRAEPNETFDTVPYYDAEEKEFWRTHWHTKDGIKEKTPADIAMLEKFFAQN